MNADESVNTWEVLPSFGFRPDPDVYSDIRPGLRLELGHLELNASFTVGRFFEKVVLFTGTLNTGYFLAEINFEVPPVMPSATLCAAWLAWSLKKSTRERDFGVPAPPWLEEGFQNIHLLPHEQEREQREREREKELAAYRSRPLCTVPRDWLRLAINTLATYMEAVPDETPITFDFDGAVLRLYCGAYPVAVAAEGDAWPQTYAVRAGQLRSLKRTRLMADPVEVFVWKNALHVGRWSAEILQMMPDTSNDS